MRSPRGQAKAITRDGFAVILARAGERAQVDRAIAGVLFHAGLRRSEAAELRWGDVEPAASIPGALTIRVRTSKTNRDGEATDVRLAKNGAAAALTALRPANAAPEALVFRGLNGQSIGRRFAAAANAAGVEGVTAHSGRVGLASELTAAGASTTETMLAGGWKTARMVPPNRSSESTRRTATRSRYRQADFVPVKPRRDCRSVWGLNVRRSLAKWASSGHRRGLRRRRKSAMRSIPPQPDGSQRQKL